MSKLRIELSNHTAYDYDDVDISFTPDVRTREITQISKVPDVSLALIQKAGGVDVTGIYLWKPIRTRSP